MRFACVALGAACVLFYVLMSFGEGSALGKRGTSVGTGISDLPSAQDWGAFQVTLLKTLALSPKKLEEVTSSLEQGASSATCPRVLRMTVRGYAERHPGEPPTKHGGVRQGLLWFQPVFATFQTPGGVADKVSWLREFHLCATAGGVWEVAEKLWHETYMQAPRYPSRRTDETRKTHVLQNAHGYVWERTGRIRAASDRSSAVTAKQLLDLAGGSWFRPSPLAMPSVFGSLPAVHVAHPPDAGYRVELDGCPLFVLQWRCHQIVESRGSTVLAPVDLTVVVDSKDWRPPPPNHPAQWPSGEANG